MDKPREIVVFGATSAIAQAYLRSEIEAQPQSKFFLVARSEEKLRVVKADIEARGAEKVVTYQADLSDVSLHDNLFRAVGEHLPECNTVLIAYGVLSDQEICEKDFGAFRRDFETNFVSTVSLIMHFATSFRVRGAGSIAVISSVAGDRGRKSNYAYGVAKGALSLYLQGLRNSLYDSGVHVLTIKPGFVDTPMTEHIQKSALFASPEVIGKGIRRAILHKKDIVYLPWFWQGIMFAIRAIPEWLFKRLSI